MPTHPTFTHENTAVNNFVNLLFISDNLNNRAQLILLSGVALNNVELIQYACQIDSTVVNTPVLNSTLNTIDAIFFPVIGKKFGDNPLQNNFENNNLQNNVNNNLQSEKNIPQ